ncbi:SdiA-regulated domain-containing protein [Pedobacter sp. MW01-1-1]|uniref:SdiA-regulated domain-containing protein n=1 Tax=Pedobacter sp. MW01-1-1 TaxID=3383027 RepID=UPI003FEE138F
MKTRNKKQFILAIALFSGALAILSCVNATKTTETVTEIESEGSTTKINFPYDLTKPVKYNMPHNLFEISGIAFLQGDPKKIYAIQDEDGDLFSLPLGAKESAYSKFAGSGDYEDLTILKNQVIVLKSNGELHVFPLSSTSKKEIPNVIKVKDLVPKAEYEGLASDEKSGMVYILTKESKADADKKATRIFAFKFDGKAGLTSAGEYALSYKQIGTFAGSGKIKFRPSALAKNPLTKQWYVLSSMNKLIVITDEKFAIQGVVPLKTGYFNQPEGIAFDKNNNLYISNEGGALSAGNVLLFKYNQQ